MVLEEKQHRKQSQQGDALERSQHHGRYGEAAVRGPQAGDGGIPDGQGSAEKNRARTERCEGMASAERAGHADAGQRYEGEEEGDLAGHGRSPVSAGLEWCQ